MSLQARPLEPIPELTRRIAQASFPKGMLAMNLRDALEAIYADDDFSDLFPKRGRAAEAPWRLALVTVLQAGENLSDRQAAEMVRGRLDWKYLLGLELCDDGFDSSILSDFRQRLVEHGAQDRLLEPILALCRERGWLVKGGKQRLDSTMVLSCVRRVNSLESVGETLRATLNELAELEPDWLMEVIEEDWFDRYVHRFELKRFPQGKEAQEELKRKVGEDGRKLLKAAKSENAPESVKASKIIEILERVWNQHYEEGEKGVRWRDGSQVTNAERIVSPYDQEARDSRKRDTEWLGYKVHLAETCDEEEEVHLITHVETTEATVQDVEKTEEILEQLAAKDLAPEKVLVDSGYVSGAIILKQQEKGREIVGPVLPETTWQQQTGYGVGAFKLDWQERKAYCPQGQESQRWSPGRGNRSEETVQIFFEPEVCQRCEVRIFCTRSRGGGRTLTLLKQEEHETLQARRAEQKGEKFQKEYAQRSGIESTLSEGVRAHGMRRSRYKGREKTHLHMTSIAAAINLSRLDTMLLRKKAGLAPRRKRALSPFARLRKRIAS